jgi:transposase, IS30 family
MPKNYNHITMDERELIAKMHWEGKELSEIANALARDKGTISRELKRNASSEYRCYTPCRAQCRADERIRLIGTATILFGIKYAQ